MSPPTHAVTLSRCPSLRYLLLQTLSVLPYILGLADTRVRSREKGPLQFETGEGPGTIKNVPNGVYKKEVPQRRLQRSEVAKPAPTTGTDSLTPRFRAVLGQHGLGLAVDWPIASYRCPRTGQSHRGGEALSNGNSTLHIPR